MEERFRQEGTVDAETLRQERHDKLKEMRSQSRGFDYFLIKKILSSFFLIRREEELWGGGRRGKEMMK